MNFNKREYDADNKSSNGTNAFNTAEIQTDYLNNTNEDEWIMDSGASSHMTIKREYFFNLRK